MKPVIIFGLGSYARVASVYLRQDSPYEVAAFTANEAYIESTVLLDKPVVPFENLTEKYPPEAYSMLVAMGARGMNNHRTHVYEQCKALGYDLITYINSRAVHWGENTFGDNTFIFENNVIQPFVTIGSNTVLWSGNHIGHDSTIGNNCFITSHAVISGHVTIGDNCFIGVNATLVDGITIAPYTFIAAGALITKDTEPEGVYKGEKARKMDFKSPDLKGF